MPLNSNPPKFTAADVAAMHAARDESYRTHLSSLLTARSISHNPATITLTDATNTLITAYQGLLTTATVPFVSEGSYVAADHGNKTYWVYLYDLVVENAL